MISGDLNIGVFRGFWTQFLIPTFILSNYYPTLEQLIVQSLIDLPELAKDDSVANNARRLYDWLIDHDADVEYNTILGIMTLAVEKYEQAQQEGEPVDNVEEIIDDSNTDILTTVQDVLGEIERNILGGQDEMADLITRTVANVIQDILIGQDELAVRTEQIYSDIVADTNEFVGLIGEILRIVSGRVDISIVNNILLPSDIFEIIIGGIGDIIDEHLAYFSFLWDEVADLLRLIFQDQLDALDEPIKDIATAIRDQTDQQEETGDELLDEVRLINDDTEEGSGSSLFESAVRISRILARDGYQPDWEDLYKGFDLDDIRACVPLKKDDADAEGLNDLSVIPDPVITSLIDYYLDATQSGDAADFLIRKALYYLAKFQGIFAISGALAQRELYEFARCSPYEIFEPGDAIAAYQRNEISREQAKNDLQMRGYNDTRAEILLNIGYQVPDLAALYSMNLRGLAAGENLNDRLRDLGYSPADAEALEALKFYLPPPQDLITMAVREVFNPEIVEKFGQDEDFPEDFAEYAEQQGISRFWAEKYWQAHWVLPSVQMGYEMLHRGVIDEETLKQLLAAQDVMPGWRDGLIAISYAPYTRVDIRRMHDVGVLDDHEVYKAYKDIGYDDSKARNLTEFTIRLNADDDELPPELDGLTRASVLAAFKDGIISRVDADAMLEDAGIGQEARDIFLTGIELDVDREERKDAVDLVLTEYENGVTGLLGAIADLARLNLTPLEQEKAEKKLRRIRAKKTKMPSKSELDRLFKAQLIDDEEYEEQLERIGYPDTYIRKFRQLIESGQTANA